MDITTKSRSEMWNIPMHSNVNPKFSGKTYFAFEVDIVGAMPNGVSGKKSILGVLIIKRSGITSSYISGKAF